MTDNLSIAVRAFASLVLMPFSVDETLIPRYVKLSTSFREPLFSVEMSQNRVHVSHVLYFGCVHMEVYATCCLLHAV